MKYTVIFGDLAHHQLADIWMRAADRQRVTDAVSHIERLLRHNAHNRGVSRPNGWRVLLVPPLAITFEVIPDDCKVNVLSMRYDPTTDGT